MSIQESTYQGMANRIDQLEERNSGLEAARIAYASEFPLNSEGEPDVGSIHQNIRKLKADYAQLEAELAEARKDQERYHFVRNMTPEQFENTSTIHEDFDRQIDAMIKEKK